MSVTDINPANAIGWCVGKAQLIKAGEVLPPDFFQVDNIVAIPGPQAVLYRLMEVIGEAAGGGWVRGDTVRQVTFSNLTQRGRRVYTLAELEAIRPLGYVIPDRPWRRLHRFVEDGFYQAWPNGRVYKVVNGFLVDAVTEVRFYGEEAKYRKEVPRLIPLLIPRWLPPAPFEGEAGAAGE